MTRLDPHSVRVLFADGNETYTLRCRVANGVAMNLEMEYVMARWDGSAAEELERIALAFHELARQVRTIPDAQAIPEKSGG